MRENSWVVREGLREAVAFVLRPEGQTCASPGETGKQHS